MNERIKPQFFRGDLSDTTSATSGKPTCRRLADFETYKEGGAVDANHPRDLRRENVILGLQVERHR